jgi:hypothetical protein
MVMSPLGLGPKNDIWPGPVTIVNDRHLLVRESTSTNPQLPDSSKTLVMSPRWGLDTKTDWPTDCQLWYDLDNELWDSCQPVQRSPHSIWYTIVKLFLKHPVIYTYYAASCGGGGKGVSSCRLPVLQVKLVIVSFLLCTLTKRCILCLCLIN